MVQSRREDLTELAIKHDIAVSRTAGLVGVFARSRHKLMTLDKKGSCQRGRKGPS